MSNKNGLACCSEFLILLSLLLCFTIDHSLGQWTCASLCIWGPANVCDFRLYYLSPSVCWEFSWDSPHWGPSLQLESEEKFQVSIARDGNPSQSYGTSPAMQYGVTQCYLLSNYLHSVQMNLPHLNPSQACQYSIYLLQEDWRLS